jgi:hypothetical protein
MARRSASFFGIEITQERRDEFVAPLRACVRRFVEQLSHRREEAPRNSQPPLGNLVELLGRVEQAPPIPGYEDIFIREGHEPLVARLLAGAVLFAGKKRLDEVRAERGLASAILALWQTREYTPLVVSRRAAKILAALDDGLAIPVLGAAWTKANLPDSEYSLIPLLKRACARDAEACKALVAICAALKPHLPDPRGRIPSLASVTHELLLHGVDCAYTYDPIDGDFNDPATMATRRALNEPTFDPRRAHERQKARLISGGPGRAAPRGLS